MRPHRLLIIALFIGSLLLTLSCSLASTTANLVGEQVDPTKVVLEIVATENAKQQANSDATNVAFGQQATQAAQGEQQTATAMAERAAQETQQALAIPTNTEEPKVTPTPDMAEKIRNAKILVYEDTQDIGMWITDALDGMGVQYTHVGDASGTFMKNLDSPTQWDLIIVGAESRSNVQGEFWDVINRKVTMNKTALVAEVWYLERLGGGKIRNIMTNCGISFQADWPLAESIYWTEPDHPLFTAPNTVLPLLNYSRYWTVSAGDLVRLTPGSTAHIVAGAFQKHNTDYGLVTVCMDGRMVFQTFSNHDFHHDEVVRLWQNYITYTLTNHFYAIGQ